MRRRCQSYQASRLEAAAPGQPAKGRNGLPGKLTARVIAGVLKGLRNVTIESATEPIS
jgi:hypothetical protein